MEVTNFASQEVEITAVYFVSSKQSLISYPRRMVYEGHEYTFLEDSLRYLVKKGRNLIKLFDVSDGQSLYRLRLDEANHWTLVNIKPAS